MASASTTLPLRSCIVTAVTVVVAFVATPEAGASELIARDATGVRIEADAQGRALISFRSEGQSRQLLAWGAVDARPPSQSVPQVAFRLRYGGSIGRNVCGAYRGPPLAWKVAACTTPDGTHWAVQAWQRMLPNYGAAPTGTRSAWEFRLSHWSGPVATIEIWTDWSYRRFHHLYGRLTYRGQGVYGFRSTRFGVPLDALRPQHLRRHLRLRVRAWLAAGEQLPDPRPGRGLLLRLLRARRSRCRQRDALPRDRHRPGRDPGRDVAGAPARRLRRRSGQPGERTTAFGARRRRALHRQLATGAKPNAIC